MDRVPGDRTDIRVPPEDGSIAQALTELDGKVAAWAAAMRAAEARLTEMSAGGRLRAKAADRSKKDQPAPGDADSEPCVVAAAPGTDSGDADAKSASIETGPVLAAAQAGRETAKEAKAEQGSTVAAAAEPHAAETEVEAESETAPDPGRDGSEDDDAALLATLDPETVKAIRVMRRLAPAKKSVRELLREYEANKANEQVAQPQKKSWFLRKR